MGSLVKRIYTLRSVCISCIMLSRVLILACVASVAFSLQCYSCNTWNDTITSCSTAICNGQQATCYKREYVYDDDDAEWEYEERGCVTNKDYLDELCEETDWSEDYKKCKIYTCSDIDRCNSATPLTVTGLLVTVAAALYF